MINLLHIASVPILAFNLGFVNPQIDLNHNIRETYRTQVIQQRQGTDERKIANEIKNSKRFQEWSKKQKENKNKSDKLESFRTRRGTRNRDFTNRLRERYNERYGDQRRVAQFYVSSWFIASFSLNLDDNTLLRIKDIYAKAISEVGLATKGVRGSREDRDWKVKTLRKIYSTFDHELRGTLDSEQYEKLIKMSGRKERSKKVNKGET